MSVRYDNRSIPLLASVFGYPRQEGLCKGIAHKGWEAILCDDIEAFHKRIRKIELLAKRIEKGDLIGKTTSYLPRFINSLEPNLYADLWAFLDGVHIAQSAENYFYIFPKEKFPVIVSQCHLLYNKETSFLTAPLKLQKEGGAAEITRFTGVYDKAELSKYFSSLKEVFLKDSSTTSIAFELACYEHAIAIGYKPSEKSWFFIDSNDLSKIKIFNDGEFVKKVFSSLVAKNNNRIIMSTVVYSTHNSLKKLQEKITEWKETKEFQEIHTVTPNKAFFYANKLERSTSRIEDKISWLLVAVQTNDFDTVLKLLETGIDINRSDLNGFTPLHIACYTGNIKIVETLLKYKADPNTISKSGTALLLASFMGDIGIVKTLLSHRADPNISSPYLKRTPLMAAAENGHAEIVKLLLKSGADKNAISENGDFAFSLAYKNRHMEIVQLVRNN